MSWDHSKLQAYADELVELCLTEDSEIWNDTPSEAFLDAHLADDRVMRLLVGAAIERWRSVDPTFEQTNWGQVNFGLRIFRPWMYEESFESAAWLIELVFEYPRFTNTLGYAFGGGLGDKFVDRGGDYRALARLVGGGAYEH